MDPPPLDGRLACIMHSMQRCENKHVERQTWLAGERLDHCLVLLNGDGVPSEWGVFVLQNTGFSDDDLARCYRPQGCNLRLCRVCSNALKMFKQTLQHYKLPVLYPTRTCKRGLTKDGAGSARIVIARRGGRKSYLVADPQHAAVCRHIVAFQSAKPGSPNKLHSLARTLMLPNTVSRAALLQRFYLEVADESFKYTAWKGNVLRGRDTAALQQITHAAVGKELYEHCPIMMHVMEAFVRKLRRGKASSRQVRTQSQVCSGAGCRSRGSPTNSTTANADRVPCLRHR